MTVSSTELAAYKAILNGDPCSYCDAPGVTFDHIHPRARGGKDEWENSTAACLSCNAKKNDRPLLLFLLGVPRDRIVRASAASPLPEPWQARRTREIGEQVAKLAPEEMAAFWERVAEVYSTIRAKHGLPPL